MNRKKSKTLSFERSRPDYKFTKKDFIILIIITVLYSAVALYNLGDMKAPKTKWDISEGQNIILDFGEVKDIGSVSYFMGEYAYYNMSVTGRNSTSDMWEDYYTGEVDYAFSWDNISVDNSCRYLMITLTSPKAAIYEIAVKDSDGNIITPVNSDAYASLFDEQDLCPERTSYRDSTYFDEIYHARTAYEYIHGLTTYENTHPPLGKIFISIGILIFGMNPFGWRIVGTIFGIMMIPAIYTFAKKMFGKTWLASIICLLFTFDFMHFSQTRIATIDVYVTFFIILMYYFMYRYISMSFYDTDFKKTLIPLGLCGLSMGLGCASKWTGCYAGVGLALLFFYHLYKRFREYRYAKLNPDGTTDGISHKHVIDVFPKYTIKTLLCCILFFIVIPGIIYILSYIPFVSYYPDKNLLERMFENQIDMFNYHSGLKSTHAYSSHWYQWPTMVRPILFYSGKVSSAIYEGISSFGNPAVWWIGIPAASIALYRAVAYSDKKARFLLVGYAAQFLPWVFVPRYTFIYHYFPSTPFVVLIIGYCMYSFYQSAKTQSGKKKVIAGCFVYCAIAIVLFVMFYPVISGMPVNKNYVLTCLRWFKSWVLIYC